MKPMIISSSENAFTGLEAAIVLIAFVVVAAVFSYVMLGAGFFTTQKSQEVVQTSIRQASSSIEIIGNVYGIAGSSGAPNLQYLKFTVGNTAGGTAVDISKMVVSYSDESTRWTNLTYAPGSSIPGNIFQNNQTWGINKTINTVGTENTLLEPGEQFILMVGVPATATVNTRFQVSLQPALGAFFQIKRTIPPVVDPVNILY